MPRTIRVDPSTQTVTVCGNVRLDAFRGRVGQACYPTTLCARFGGDLREFDVLIWPETYSSKTVEINGKVYHGSVIVETADVAVLAGHVEQNVAWPA